MEWLWSASDSFVIYLWSVFSSIPIISILVTNKKCCFNLFCHNFWTNKTIKTCAPSGSFQPLLVSPSLPCGRRMHKFFLTIYKYWGPKNGKILSSSVMLIDFLKIVVNKDGLHTYRQISTTKRRRDHEWIYHYLKYTKQA